jgi:hypothetical protein
MGEIISLEQKLTEETERELQLHLQGAEDCRQRQLRIAQAYGGQLSLNTLFDDIRCQDGKG